MRLLLSIAVLVVSASAFSQTVSLTTYGTAYTQNFDSLSNTASSTTNSLGIAGWFLFESGGGTRDNELYAVDGGGSNIGDTYSYGGAGLSERALGGLQSSSLVPTFGAAFSNNTGGPITSLKISYTGEQWRIGNTAASRDDRLDFQYSTNATTLISGTWTDVDPLDFTNPIKTAPSAGALNGNAAGNRVSLSYTITGLNIPNGSTFWIRWTDFNASGSDDGLAIDDFSLVAEGGTLQPLLSINDVSVVEGNSGTATAVFTISLDSPAPAGGVTFDISTADNTASSSAGDYVSRLLAGQTIPAGSSTFLFSVSVGSDIIVEPDETFFVNVVNVVGATVMDGQGVGTISNDDYPPIAISSIQGRGATSPLAGSVVSTTGIVTAVRSNAFFIQTPDALVDADSMTSEGILVYTGSTPPAAAAVGNLVQVSGTVTEFIPSALPNSLPLTQITTPTVVLQSAGNPLPVPIAITSSVLTPTGGLSQLERFEGMRVSVSTLTVVAPTEGSINQASATASSTGVFFGVLSSTGMPFREPGILASTPVPTCAAVVNCAVPVFDGNPERIRVDSNAIAGQSTVNVTTGNTVTNIVGVLDFSGGNYTIYPTVAPSVTTGSAVVAKPIPSAPSGSLTVVSANLLRLFDTVNDPNTGDPVLSATAYANRLGKISLAVRNYLLTPDILALEEVENLTVAQDLASRINADAVAAGQSSPDYVPYLFEGNDIGGIDVALLVRSSQVSVSEVIQLGKDATYAQPPDNSLAILNDRPPLRLRGSATKGAQTLSFTLFVVHLRSLNGIDDESQPSNGPRVRAKRAAQANFVSQLVQDELIASPGARILVAGDFNAFQVNDGYVDVVNAISGSPAPSTQVVTATSDPAYPTLTTLVSMVPVLDRYSYVFDGSHQALDHILATPTAIDQFSGGGYAHLNSDFPETLFGVANRPERFSDHDPAFLFLTTARNITGQAGLTLSTVSYNRTKTSASSKITIRNNSTSSWTGPLNLVISNLTNGITITNAKSATGATYVYSLASPLAPGQSTTVTLNYAVSSTAPIIYTPKVFLGTL